MNTCSCGVEIGSIHELGCDQEVCPFCAGQLITCPCSNQMKKNAQGAELSSLLKIKNSQFFLPKDRLAYDGKINFPKRKEALPKLRVIEGGEKNRSYLLPDIKKGASR